MVKRGELGREAWRRLERLQGNAFISDALAYENDEAVLRFLRTAAKAQWDGCIALDRLILEYTNAHGR
jgi:hypothetical protein